MGYEDSCGTVLLNGVDRIPVNRPVLVLAEEYFESKHLDRFFFSELLNAAN